MPLGMPEGVQFKHPADSSCPEKKGSSLPKMSRTQRSNLTLRQFTPPDIVNETPSYSLVSSPLEEEAFNYEGLDRESGNTEDDVVTRNAANMDTARALIFIPQPSTSREEEQPSTSRQADVRAVETNDITVSSGSATGGIRQASFAMDNNMNYLWRTAEYLARYAGNWVWGRVTAALLHQPQAAPAQPREYFNTLIGC
ncbi:hypothetical protein C0Q70_10520 [Pomacea canaliculata]|uniref:Uncharacterized protein n=1 Tax=Pomacea canaliculata TaxID=400727 RepID=A0A2T7P3D9_POMCA|nr:hypothetical protein C0Q70_10520 [Pomacea canaliculata]